MTYLNTAYRYFLVFIINLTISNEQIFCSRVFIMTLCITDLSFNNSMLGVTQYVISK